MPVMHLIVLADHLQKTKKEYRYLTLREKLRNTEFFWSVFFCIPTWKNIVFGHFSHSVKKQEIQDIFSKTN